MDNQWVDDKPTELDALKHFVCACACVLATKSKIRRFLNGLVAFNHETDIHMVVNH